MNILSTKWKSPSLLLIKCCHCSDKVSNSNLPLSIPLKKSLTPNNDSKDKLEPLKYTKANKWHATYTFKNKSNDSPNYQGTVLSLSILAFMLYLYFREENSVDRIFERKSVAVNSDGSITVNISD